MNYQGRRPSGPKNFPVGPCLSASASLITGIAPCSGVSAPVLPLRSVLTLPGSTTLILMPCSANSLAKHTVAALSATFEAL